MCFIISEKHPKPKTARKDIVCWKFGNKVNGRFKSLVQDFTYTRNRVTKKVEFNIQDDKIYAGYHSHSIKRWHCNAEFVIPKGSKYYCNPTHKKYVSNQIKFVKWL